MEILSFSFTGCSAKLKHKYDNGDITEEKITYKNSNISVDEVKGKYESDMDSNNYVYYMMQAVK